MRRHQRAPLEAGERERRYRIAELKRHAGNLRVELHVHPHLVGDDWTGRVMLELEATEAAIARLSRRRSQFT
jgi:hypothetical protein